MKKLLWICLGAALLMLSPLFAYAQTQQYALFVYMTGSNLETDNGAATKDIEEMQAHLPKDGSVRLFLLAGGAEKWHNGLENSTILYEMTANGLEKKRDFGLCSMGDSETLRNFLQYGYEQAHGSRCGLILWDHGAGPLSGVCFDERFAENGRMDALTLDEMTEALQNSPFAQNELEWIGFDACLMATMETASAVAPYASYMVASQDTEPASGWNYAFLQDLPHLSARETGKRIVEAYFEAEGDSFSTITLSCIDLQKIPALAQGMDALFGPLSQTVNADSYADYAALRTDTKGLACTSTYEYDLVDLRDLLEVFEAGGAAECDVLLHLFDEAVVHSRSNTRYINGLSVYYPYYNKEQFWEKRGEAAAFSAGYQDFLTCVTHIWLGEALADWQQTGCMTAEEQNGITHLRMPLSEWQAVQFSSAKLHVLEKLYGAGWQRLYTTNDVRLTEDACLTAQYAGEALFVLDEEGELITTALGYRTNTEGDIVLHAILYKTEGSAVASLPCRLVYRKLADGQLQLIEAVEATTDPLLEGKAQVNLDEWDEMQLVSNLFELKCDENGALLPDVQWPVSGMVGIHNISLREKAWTIGFAQAHDSGERYALLEMTDAQQNTVYSELVPIRNPYLSELPVQPQVLHDSAEFTLSFVGAQQATGVDPLARVLLSCKNRTQQPLIVSDVEIMADNVMVSRYRLGHSNRIAAGTEEVLDIALTDDMLKEVYMDAFSTVTLRLTCGYDYTDSFFDARFTLPVAADLSADIGPLPAREAIASGTWHGIEIELSDLHLEDHDLHGQVRLHNTTDQTVRMDGMQAYVQNVRVTGSLTGGLTAVELLPGSMMYTKAKLLTGVHEWPSGRKCADSVLSQVGIDCISQVGFDVFHSDFRQAERVDFVLAEPIKISLTKTTDWPLIYDQGGVRVSLMEVSCDPESKYVADFLYNCLYVENNTDREVRVRWAEEGLRINGETGYMASGGMTVPAHTSAGESMYFVRPDQQPMTHFDSLTGTLQVIQGDETHGKTRTLTASDMRQEGSEKIYTVVQGP